MGEKMKIGLDTDEVITEFVRGYLKLYNSKYKKNVSFEDIYSYDLWVPLQISKARAFWLARQYYNSEDFGKIDLVSGARQGIEKLAQNNELFIVTARPFFTKDKTSYFFRKNFPIILPNNIIYSGDIFNGQGKLKAEICAEKSLDVFVEDRKEYALECAEKGIKVLLFNKPWNKNTKHKNIEGVNSWNEILEKINGMRN